jgi:hypothetical protein
MQQEPQMVRRQSLLKRRKNSCEPAEKDSKQLKWPQRRDSIQKLLRRSIEKSGFCINYRISFFFSLRHKIFN